MSEDFQTTIAPSGVEDVLQHELVKGDVAIAATRPLLLHLLANTDGSMFSDQVLATIRGMVNQVAQQLLYAQAEAANISDWGEFAAERQESLTQLLFEDSAFLAHMHSQVLEFRLVEQLQHRSGIDGVLSPLLQELAASSDGAMATSAMHVLAAQARFIQQQRRMDLPLGELPGDMFHKALLMLRHLEQDGETAVAVEVAEAAEAKLRGEFDEATSRLGQITQLVMSMGRKATRALSIDHAGVAIFSTALAMASGQDRNLAVLSFGENQLARLALSLRAAGLKQADVEEQFLFIHPEIELPPGFEELSNDRAAAMLAGSQPEAQA